MNKRARRRFAKNEGGLYLLTPPRICLQTFPDVLSRALEAGGVSCLQIRLKFPPGESRDSGRVRRECVEVLAPLARRFGVAVLMNDDARLAGESGADGVHIGQQDGSVDAARASVGGGIVGVTCHDSLELAHAAQSSGADYVAFGSFFASSNKPDAVRAPLEILSHWREKGNVPCVAIGGITTGNAAELLRAGADYLAVCEGVWGHAAGPAAAVQEFAALSV
ncbi:MAG: thiamine phosphate synthase [Hyphomicrobiales bacterium]|nr:thiamine phosphate synthase [Hyphomicrobiales bacterium]